MRSFILITFAFLGFAFYELSGGADYQPAPDSLQARAASGVDAPTQIDVAVLGPTKSAQDDQSLTRAVSSLGDLTARRSRGNEGDRVDITLASINGNVARAASSSALAASRTEPRAIEAAIEEAVNARPEPMQPTEEILPREVFSLETYVAMQGQAQTFGTSFTRNAGGDRREVTGDRVNMRAGPGTDFERVGAVSRGTEVIVLDAPGNGWLMLEVVETGETGWMADWLVTGAN